MNTKYGVATLRKDGYYQITSWKEGNHNKLLHRLIFEDIYGPIPDDCVIHHKDGNKLNNCIMNLQLLTEYQHKSLHQKGKIVSLETRKRLSSSLKDRKYSDETLKKMSESHKYRIPSITKKGFNKGKQVYCIYSNKKVLSQSVNKTKIEQYYFSMIFNIKYNYI